MDFGKKRSEAKLIRVGFRVKASESEQRKTKRDAKNARRAFFVLQQFLRQKFFLLSAKNRTKTRTKLCFMKKKHFFRKIFSQNCENHPIFWVRNAAY